MAIATADLTFKVDLDSMTPIKEIKGGYLAYGDVKAHQIHVACYEGDTPKTLSSVQAVGIFVRADKTAVTITGTISGNEVIVLLPQECYAVPGDCGLIVRLVHGDGTKRAILWLRSMVVDTEYTETVNPGDPLPDISDLLAAIASMNQASAAVAAAVAAESDFESRIKYLEDRDDIELQREIATRDYIPGTNVYYSNITENGYTVEHYSRIADSDDHGVLIRVDTVVIDETNRTLTETRQVKAGGNNRDLMVITTNMDTLKTTVVYTPYYRPNELLFPTD